jgi:alanine racemase
MTDDETTIEQLTAGAHALIDLDAYAGNIELLRDMLPAGMAFMAVVKADGYGHGAAQCAAAARAAGAEWVGVARIDEALRLRAAGDAGPLLVLGPPNPTQIADAFQRDVTITLGAREALDAVVDAARMRPGAAHLKVDTGMRRYGFMPDDVVGIAKQLSAVDGLRIDGIFTHFAMADDRDPSPTAMQLARFEAVLAALDEQALRPPRVHAANSAAILTGRLGASNLARAGIATYGLSPSAEVTVDSRFQPVLSMRAPVSRVFELAAGDGVSYGWSYRSDASRWAAVAPIGYADGVPRALSNVGWVNVSGERRAILGRVCMDQMVVEAAEATKVGELIDVVGGAGMSADEAGRLAGTLNYEIVARLAARVPRIYIRNGLPVAWSTPANCQGGDFRVRAVTSAHRPTRPA